MSIVFAKTRFNYADPDNGYGSYTDFWKLVELSGFETCYVDEIDTASDATYIFTPANGETISGWPAHRARIIHWNLEQDPYPPIPGVAETWASDKKLAQLIDAKYVPMGSHEDLNTETEAGFAELAYDAIMLAYRTPRRIWVQAEAEKAGVAFAPDGWHQARHQALLQSRVMLHVHQNEGKYYVAPQRFAIAAAYGLPLISEALADLGIFSSSTLLTSDLLNLPTFVKMWTQGDEHNLLDDYGYQLHRLLCHIWPFRRCVEEAL